MDYGHPLRFGTFLTPTSAAPRRPIELAVLSEELGFDLVTFQDHPYQPAFLDTWTLLSWVAARTTRIHLAPNVLNVPMRPPAVVARAAASLDLLAAGRVELALGAGAFWDAMVAMGVPRLTAGESVEALSEAIGVIRSSWAASGGQAPAHDVPIWLGALRPRMLRLVGAAADGWLPSLGRLGPGDLRSGQAVIDEAAAEAGRDPREVRRLLNISGRFGTGTGTGQGGPLTGRSTQWVDELVPLALDDGVSTFILASDEPEALRQFAAEVAPALREAVAAERASRGVTESTMRSTAVRAARRAAIDYDAIPAALAEAAVEPGDAVYGSVRSTYMRGGSPGLVLRPDDAEQVATAVTWARSQHVPLAVRSAGHGISGRSTNDGGIVIDLSRMRAIEVLDPATRRVRIEPGARWGEVAAALAPYGWALTSGDYGGVGVGGLATAGGIGFLVREHGLTLDHLRAVDVVLADGSLVHASETQDADLFWGVRGAGGNLGIVTSFEFEVDEVGDLGFAQLTLDASDTATFIARFGAVVEAAPRDLTAFLIIGRPRAGQVLGQVIAVVDSDDPDTIIDRLQPLADLAPLVGQSVRIVSYPEIVSLPDVVHAGQGEPVTRSGLVEHLTADVAAAAARLIHGGESYFFQIRSVGGAAGDVDPDATAYAHRSANFSVVAFGSSRPRLDAQWAELEPFVTGIYTSFETDRRPERLLDAYPPRTLARLRELKRRHDPDNVFRHNFPIAPA